MANNYFSEDYASSQETKIEIEDNSVSNQIEIESEEYEINKPKRIIMRGKIVHGKGN